MICKSRTRACSAQGREGEKACPSCLPSHTPQALNTIRQSMTKSLQDSVQQGIARYKVVFCPQEHFHISPWAPQKHQDRVFPLLLSAELSWVKRCWMCSPSQGHCHDTSALQKEEAPSANAGFKIIRCFVDTTESTQRCSFPIEGQCKHLSLLPLHLYISPHPQ